MLSFTKKENTEYNIYSVSFEGEVICHLDVFYGYGWGGVKVSVYENKSLIGFSVFPENIFKSKMEKCFFEVVEEHFF